MKKQQNLDAIAERLPSWKASLIHPAGRATLIKAVLSSIPIYLQIAIHCPKWVIKAIEKILRGFLWKGCKEIKGGTIWLGGSVYVELRSLVALVFII
jgi:hypothetical protein